MSKPESPAPAAAGRVSTGNPGVDAMLDGGFVPHRPYLIVGPSGTGKTTLALQFLCEGVRRGERVLFVTLEEPPNEVRLNHRSLAPDLDRVEVFDAIPDVMRYERAPFKDIASVREISPFSKIAPQIRKSPELTSVEVTITALEQMLRSEVIKRNYSRIAVDSLTALQYFCMKGFDPIGGAQTFLRFLSDLRTTTVLTVESPLEDVETAERMLARGEIRLFRWELEGVTVRAIGVEKFRGSSHDVRLHPYRIGRGGLDVNLAVTISRDTRQIVEPHPSVAVPVPVAPALVVRPVLEPVSEEVRDLVAIGVDVGAVRGVVETALAAVRGGRSDEAAAQIARLASITSGLAASVAADPSAAGGPASPRSDAIRRIVQRADSIRMGVPPTVFPDPSELEHQLGQVLAQIPVAAPATAPESPRPPPAGAPTPPSEEPAPPRAVAEPVPPPTPASPVPEPTAEPTPEPPPAREPPAPLPTATVERVAPTRAAHPIPEPPPLPQRSSSLPAVRPTGAPPSSPTATKVSAPSVRATPVAPAEPAPPPLPVIAPIAPPPPAPSTPSAPPEEIPTAAPKRRRRSSAPKKKAGEPAAVTESTAGAPASEAVAPKPKRRVVRKRKAPPVVAATAEPLPKTEAEPPPPAPPSGGE